MEGVVVFLLIVGLVVSGLLPTIIAFTRHHPERWSIFALNFALGGKSLGWGVALTWSLQTFEHEQSDQPNMSGQREKHPMIIDTYNEEQMPVEEVPVVSDTQECPYCAETIKAKAKICRYCGSKLSQEQPA
jgi:hypothetical protein